MPALLFFALAAPRPAEACSPAFARVLDTAPSDGATEVPADAVIRVYFGDGYTNLTGQSAATVTVDGVPISGTIETWARAIDLIEEQGLLTFTPDSPLPVGASVSVEVTGAKKGPDTFSFAVGDGAVTVVTEAPSLLMTQLTHVALNPKKMSSCDDEAWWEVSWTVLPVVPDPSGLSLVEIHRVSPDWDGTLEAPFRIIGPMGADARATLSSRYAVSPSDGDDPTEQCFVAVVRDGAGNASPPSDMHCGQVQDTGADHDTGVTGKAGTGCAAVPVVASLWGPMLALGAILRRRV